MVSHRCSPTGGLFARVSGPGSFAAAFSPDFGVTWTTPRLSRVTSVTAGASCAVYATRDGTTDAFVAK